MFSQVAVSNALTSDLGADDTPPERVNAAAVSEDFFTVLGASPIIGRSTFARSMLLVVHGATAMLATYVPALRATRVEPLTALRHE